ncbi:helix-turn-helix domain-containing protein [Lentzea flaviverrucosa]|uniref:Helix-turn-helix domain-containing protein n=1 Tax=Lentzea flaviverrucosa TaxID=200379 RepID=A0A1H9XVW1_9PSEU|nr:helix-turn-helix transcriptional regulator [Lentzea flaviverrucosa]RDI18381.1 helix-turn-helix protein [Lentzea flaviverrucosa]SES50318.1 Helix-turn-helix domain-containing protein [Lentzea flaviverrucosa]
MTPSTAYSRDLGDELRSLRETCTGLSGNKLAVKLGWDPSKVSTIEHGKARASEVDLIQYLSMCDRDIDFINDFRRRYQYAFDEYRVQVSDNLRAMVMAEATATAITSYDVLAMPGLMQSPEYAAYVYRMTGMVAEERIPDLVQYRTDRQAILRRHDRPTCVFYIHEHALDLQVGNAEVMEDQYARLLFNPHTIRIVPKDAPIVASSFVLWEFDKARPLVFSETNLANVFVEDPGAIARTRLLFGLLDELALSAEQSRSKLAEYVSPPREDFDDSGPHLAY